VSKLAKAAAAKGFAFPVKKTSDKKTNMAEIPTPAAIAATVDSFLVNTVKMDEIKATLDSNVAELRAYSLDLALTTKDMKNQILTGKEGAVNVIFKDQYSMNPERKEQLDEYLTSKGLKPEDFVTEKTSVNFDFDAMTQPERDALINFLGATLGAERCAQLVAEKTTYEIKGLKDKIPAIAKDADDMANLRSISGHYSPSIAARKEKTKL